MVSRPANSSSTTPITSPAALRARKPSLPPLSDYPLRFWLNSAQDVLEQGKWEPNENANVMLPEKSGKVSSTKRLEEAYLANKKAAAILNHLKEHREFEKTKMTETSEHKAWFALRTGVLKASEINKAIMQILEDRESNWNAVNTPSPAQRPTEPELPTSSSSADQPAAPNSITQRLAALRAGGMQGATHIVRTSSRPQSLTPGMAPPKPHKPDELRRSPPGSPQWLAKPEPLDEPGRRDPEAITGLGLQGLRAELDRISNTTTISPPSSSSTSNRNRSKSPLEQLETLASPPNSPPVDHDANNFGAHFPSLRDFEKSEFSRPPSSSGPTQDSFPSPPTFNPGSSSPTRHATPLPPPPRPFELDAAEFEKMNREREEAMRRLSGKGRDTPPVSSSAGEGGGGIRNSVGIPKGLNLGIGSTSTNGSRPLPTTPNRASIPSRPILSSSSSSGNVKVPSIPYTNEVLPKALYAYLSQALDSADNGGPTVLILDVRNRDEFDRGRIIGDTICLEPVVLRPGISALDLESALLLSPAWELEHFASRHLYDVIVVYDRSSTSFPNGPPPSTSSDAQRALWNLTSAIYEHEFTKSLKRQPILLKGGWEAWEKDVGSVGIVPARNDTSNQPRGRDSNGVDSDVKRRNRAASIVSAGGPGGPTILSPPAYGQSSGAGNYFSSSTATQHYNPNTGPLSPRLALPPTAVQRTGSASSYDSYPTSFRPTYPQPHLYGPTLPPMHPSSSSLPSLHEDYSNMHSQSQQQQQSYQSYSNDPRPSIDYPQLQPSRSYAPPPPVSYSTRPPIPQLPYHSTTSTPPTLTRPPPVQPAPLRSSSSISLPSYTPSKLVSSYMFGDNAIGLTGLKNLGNTCYMNSTIQCLSATIPFARYFKDGTWKRDVNVVNPLGTKGALASAVSELIRAMWAQDYMFLSPVTFREQICRFAPQFGGSDQHDAQEFLGFLLDGLHEDLNYIIKKPAPVEMTADRENDLETLPQQVMSEREWLIYRRRNDSFVVQCFQGQFRNQMKCLTCGKTSTTYNTFMPLSIPVPAGRGISKVTLQDCIATFVREEILDKEDAWFCPRCKKNRKTSKKLSLSRLPPILVIHLKRFSFKGPFSDKIETQVQYPLSGLDLTSFVPPPLFDHKALPLTSPAKGQVYDLYGVTNHYGNLSSGHYTAYVRNQTEWHHIGDSKVTPVTPQTVESNSNSYILWYRKA